MGGSEDRGGAPAVRLRRSARARRMTLRVSAADGSVSMTVPSWVSDGEALAFAREKADWIARARARTRPAIPVRPGIALPLGGRPLEIRAGPGRSARLADGAIIAPEHAGPAVAALLKRLAQDRLGPRVEAHAAALGREVARVSYRDTRSRWGSCTSEGNVMLSWRLVMAPEEVADYVVAHEVAHLERLDHSPAFWEVVEGLCPDWQAKRDWLRREGGGLMSYVFRR